MSPSSVRRPISSVSGTVTGKKTKKPGKTSGGQKGLFGLLKGWTIDSPAISDELKE